MRNPTRLSHQFIKTPTVVKVPTLDRVSIQMIIETIGKESLAIKIKRRTINNMYGINKWMDKVTKAYRKIFKKTLRPSKLKQPTKRKSNAVAKKPTRKTSK
jgi:hypothetical protein